MLKRLLALFICSNIVYSPAYCAINDDFVEKNLPKNLSIRKAQPLNISDEFVDQSLDKSKKVKPINLELIVDSFAEQNTQKNIYVKPIVNFDEQIVQLPAEKLVRRKAVVLNENSEIPVNIRIRKDLSTKHKIDEGDYIEFETLSEVKTKNRVYPAGTIVKGRIETISLNKSLGVPSDLTVGNFSIEGQSLNGEINKIGANRALWLYPTIYTMTCFFGIGLLLIPIRGGHAKIKTNQVYTVHF